MLHFDFVTKSNSLWGNSCWGFLTTWPITYLLAFLRLRLSLTLKKTALFSKTNLFKNSQNWFATVYFCSGCLSESPHTEIRISKTLLEKWDLFEMLFERSISWSWRNSISLKGDMVIQVFFLKCVFLIRSMLV